MEAYFRVTKQALRFLVFGFSGFAPLLAPIIRRSSKVLSLSGRSEYARAKRAKKPSKSGVSVSVFAFIMSEGSRS